LEKLDRTLYPEKVKAAAEVGDIQAPTDLRRNGTWKLG
jgi:hypothetical protein